MSLANLLKLVFLRFNNTSNLNRKELKASTIPVETLTKLIKFEDGFFNKKRRICRYKMVCQNLMYSMHFRPLFYQD